MGTMIIIQAVLGLRPDRRKANLAPFLSAIELKLNEIDVTGNLVMFMFQSSQRELPLVLKDSVLGSIYLILSRYLSRLH
jgi:hypothetical protein